MTSLPTSLSLITTRLQESPLCQAVSVVETQQFSAEQFLCKVRADLEQGLKLQGSAYYNHGHCDYSYQLFRNVPIMRWDNKEDCPGLPNFPHHHHTPDGSIVSSPLSGEPEQDLPVVLQAIATFAGPTLSARDTQE